MCPHCQASLEFRIRPDALELGYTYWAGSMHFEALCSRRVKGLCLLSADGRLFAVLAGRSFPLTPLPQAQGRGE